MVWLYCLTVILFVPFLSGLEPLQPSYRAAVVEYKFERNSTLSQDDNMNRNVQDFVDYIRKAAEQEAQIIVFPENGLSGNLFELPDPNQKVIVADDLTYPEALRKISSEARSNRIYVVLNVVERHQTNENEYHFNSDIAFDNNGSLVARYRKYNLFGEIVYMNTTEQPEHSMFTTDFGVTFGLFTCFDIMFGEPGEVLYSKYGVRDFAFPNHWYSEMPFLLSIQEQFAWSYGHDTNLLASGLKNVSQGSSGSGIYRGRLADPLYSMNSVESTVLLVGDVPIRENNDVKNLTALTANDYTDEAPGQTTVVRLKREPKFEAYNPGPVFSRSNFTYTRLCNGSLCCTFNVTYTRRTIYNDTNLNIGHFKYHRPAVLNGVRLFPPAVQVGGVQICGVIGCLTKEVASCSLGKNNVTIYAGIDSIFDDAPTHFDPPPADDDADNWFISEIKISGNFLTDNTIITPNAFLASRNSCHIGELPKIKDLEFGMSASNGTGECIVDFSLKSEVEVINCGIYSRVLSRDTSSTNSCASFPSISCTIAVALMFLLSKIHFN